MKLTGQALTDSMQDALNKVRGTVGAVAGKAKEMFSPGTDEDKKKMLGSGMARQAADAITKRKKDIDAAMGE